MSIQNVQNNKIPLSREARKTKISERPYQVLFYVEERRETFTERKKKRKGNKKRKERNTKQKEKEKNRNEKQQSQLNSHSPMNG